MRRNLNDLLKEVRMNCESGDRKTLRGVLRQIMDDRLGYYHDSVAAGRQEEYSDALFKILLLELDEEEEESIETAELAYVGLGAAIKGGVTDERYKRRLLLLHYFSDYFTDAVIEIFLKKYRKDYGLEARNLAMECLDKMKLADMLWLDENCPGFVQEDEQLSELAVALPVPAKWEEKERKEAILLHRVLQAYLEYKYKNRE